jgi:hypothetical protein
LAGFSFATTLAKRSAASSGFNQPFADVRLPGTAQPYHQLDEIFSLLESQWSPGRIARNAQQSGYDYVNNSAPATAAEAVTWDSPDNKLSRRGDAADGRGALARWQNMD